MSIILSTSVVLKSFNHSFRALASVHLTAKQKFQIYIPLHFIGVDIINSKTAMFMSKKLESVKGAL